MRLIFRLCDAHLERAVEGGLSRRFAAGSFHVFLESRPHCANCGGKAKNVPLRNLPHGTGTIYLFFRT